MYHSKLLIFSFFQKSSSELTETHWTLENLFFEKQKLPELFPSKHGITVYIDKNYGIGKDAETNDYAEYSAGTDLTDVINTMKNAAKNDTTLSSDKYHRYSFYIKYMGLESKKRKIYVNKTEKKS